MCYALPMYFNLSCLWPVRPLSITSNPAFPQIRFMYSLKLTDIALSALLTTDTIITFVTCQTFGIFSSDIIVIIIIIIIIIVIFIIVYLHSLFTLVWPLTEGYNFPLSLFILALIAQPINQYPRICRMDSSTEIVIIQLIALSTCLSTCYFLLARFF